MNLTDFISTCQQTWGEIFLYVKSHENLYSDYTRCYKNVLRPFHLQNGSNRCFPEFDCFGCWPSVRENETATIPCSSHVQLFDSQVTIRRHCGPNQSWSSESVLEYEKCIQFENKSLASIYLFIAGYALSIGLLTLSICILGYFRQLRCDRNKIHINLFVSFVMTGIFWILYLSLAALDGIVLDENPVWCRAIHVLCQYFTISNFFWMFCEGFYLHTVLVLAFHTGKNLIIAVYLIGWVLPLVLIIPYIGLRSSTDSADGQEFCWIKWNSYQWINFGPIIASMLLNIVFLANIVRVIVIKLRAFDIPSDDNSSQTRKAARATIILVPLLGLQFLIMPVRPDPETLFDEIYHYIVAAVTSLQGACVALIYCFLNGEVISVLKRRWNQLQIVQKRQVNRGLSTTMSTYTDNLAPNAHSETREMLDLKNISRKNSNNDSSHLVECA